MNFTSFKKGENFEKYVEEVLFSEKEYTLIHRTNSFEQNQNRYAENTLFPDFKFRCKKTNTEFYVEAKFRSKFNFEDKLQIMSLAQRDRFISIQESENTPIFIAIGYEGIADSPNSVSLIPLNELIYLDLYPTFLKKFQIEKRTVSIETLNLNTPFSSYNAIENSIHQDKSEQYIQKTKKSKKTPILISLVAIIIIALSLFSYGSSDNDIENILRQKTKQYYQTVDLGDVESLENYINPKVSKWYTHSNITFDEIKTITYDYLEKFPKSKTEVRWDSFNVEKINDDYLATYKLIYQIKTKGKYYNKIYHLKIKALWGENLKLKSLTEERE